MTTRRYGHAAVVYAGCLYVAGGFGSDFSMRSAEFFDAAEGKWDALPNLLVPRHELAAVVIGSALIVLGGRSDPRTALRVLPSIESIDLSSEGGQWMPLEPMTSPRYGLAAVTLGPHLYVIGGADASSCPLSSVERSDLASPGHRWKNSRPMTLQRYALAATKAKGRIFACGGRGPWRVQAGVESFSPAVGRWEGHGKSALMASFASLISTGL